VKNAFGSQNQMERIIKKKSWRSSVACKFQIPTPWLGHGYVYLEKAIAMGYMRGLIATRLRRLDL
jgi:hypothetical protein